MDQFLGQYILVLRKTVMASRGRVELDIRTTALSKINVDYSTFSDKYSSNVYTCVEVY
jgi:hypothetical protein